MSKEVAKNDETQNIEEQLVALREAAKRSATELEKFSYAISHDLRSPLRAILGYSAALQEDYGDRLDEDANRFLERIAVSARKMDELISSILSFSRISRAELNRSEVDLSPIAATVAADLARKYPNAQIEIEPGIIVSGDPTLLRIVLVNLMENACKFSSGAKDSKVNVGVVDPESGGTVAVSDNGVGFDQAHAEKVFGPFEKLDTESELSGVGIGLYNVRRIVERHGGKVWAESKPGAGATFYFTTAQ